MASQWRCATAARQPCAECARRAVWQTQALCGPRVFTFFLYLSDVEEGGGTSFPRLNLTVHPKRGSAVWWPHGYNDNPWRKDDRTHHEAMPVIKGTKCAANTTPRPLGTYAPRTC